MSCFRRYILSKLRFIKEEAAIQNEFTPARSMKCVCKEIRRFEIIALYPIFRRYVRNKLRFTEEGQMFKDKAPL